MSRPPKWRLSRCWRGVLALKLIVSAPFRVLNACLLACLLACGRAGGRACLPCLALPCLASGLLHSWHPPASTLLARPRGRGWCWVGVPASRGLPRLLAGRPAGASRSWPTQGVPTAARWEQEQEVASARRGAGPTLPEAMRRESIRTGYAIGCWRSSWLRWAPRPSYPLDSGAARGRWEPRKGLPPPCRGGATRGSPGTATPDAPRLRGAAKAAAGERPMGGGASMGLQLLLGRGVPGVR